MGLNEIETAVVAAHRGAESSRVSEEGTPAAWLEFGLTTLLAACRRVRQERLASFEVDYKGDGSPVTRIDQAVEREVIAGLKSFAPDAVVVGEECGGALPGSGMALAIDPIDGTWAFLNRLENIATTLAGFRDGEPFLGMVANPTTGEVAYAMEAGPTRLLQLSLYGDEDQALELPLVRADKGPVLVNLHPTRRGLPLLAELHAEWRAGELRMVRSPGGSPAWALLEAAKGSFVYANLWSKRPAEPYDLAAGVLLLRGAGGDVTDLDGQPIDLVSHSGPFVAGVDSEHRAVVTDLMRKAIRDEQ